MTIQNGTPRPSQSWSLKTPQVAQADRDAEIKAVLAHANALVIADPLDGLGPLSLADARDDDDYSYFLQLSSDPLPALDGWEFRFDMPRRNAGRDRVEDTAAKMVAGARALLKSPRDLAKELRAARGTVVRAITHGVDHSAPVELVALGVASVQSDIHLKLVADLRVLGVDLSYGVDRVHAPDAGSLADKIDKLLAEHRERARIIARNEAAGCKWRIDAVAQRLLDELGLDRELVFSLLFRDRQVEFHFGGAEGCDNVGTLYWDDGTVRGDFERFGKPLRLTYGTLLIQGGALPATIVASLAGRRLDVGMSHPLLPGECLIDGVDDQGEWVYLHLTVPTEPLLAGRTPTGRAAA